MKYDNLKNYNILKLDITERIGEDKTNTTNIIDTFYDRFWSDDPYDYLVLSGVGLYAYNHNDELEYYDIDFCLSFFKPERTFQKKRFAISTLFDKLSFIIKTDCLPSDDIEQIIFKAISCAEGIGFVDGIMIPLSVAIPVSAQTSYQHKNLWPNEYFKLFVKNISLTPTDPPKLIRDMVESFKPNLTEAKKAVEKAKNALPFVEQEYSELYKKYVDIKMPLLNEEVVLHDGNHGNIVKIKSNYIFVKTSDGKIRKFDIYYCMKNQSIQFCNYKTQERFKNKSDAYNAAEDSKNTLNFMKSKIEELEKLWK